MTHHQMLIERGFELKSACYPYGDCPEASQSIVKSLGYSCALAVDKWPGADNPMKKARLVIAYSDGVAKLLYRLYIRPFLP